jgi:hypothetical protein
MSTRFYHNDKIYYHIMIKLSCRRPSGAVIYKSYCENSILLRMHKTVKLKVTGRPNYQFAPLPWRRYIPELKNRRSKRKSVAIKLSAFLHSWKFIPLTNWRPVSIHSLEPGLKKMGWLSAKGISKSLPLEWQID